MHCYGGVDEVGFCGTVVMFCDEPPTIPNLPVGPGITGEPGCSSLFH